jgi:hypothetical protein
MKKFVQDLIVTASGAATSIVTAILLFLIEQNFQFSFHTLTYWLVFPWGAILAGFLAAGGYYVGARWVDHRPTPLMLLNMVGVSVGTFLLIHWLGYTSLDVAGKPISDEVSFGTYLDSRLRHTSFQITLFYGREKFMTDELGAGGYVYALLQISGFAFAGIVVCGYLCSLPYCEKCSRYLSGIGIQTRFASDPDAFALMVQQLVTLFDAGRLQEAINRHTTFGKPKHSKELFLWSVLELKRCRGCGVNWLGFSAHKQTGDERSPLSHPSWKKIKAFARFGREGLNLPG